MDIQQFMTKQLNNSCNECIKFMIAKMSDQISLGTVVTAWEQDARLGCLTDGCGPSPATSPIM